jgi:hypothetical protein
MTFTEFKDIRKRATAAEVRVGPRDKAHVWWVSNSAGRNACVKIRFKSTATPAVDRLCRADARRKSGSFLFTGNNGRGDNRSGHIGSRQHSGLHHFPAVDTDGAVQRNFNTRSDLEAHVFAASENSD